MTSSPRPHILSMDHYTAQLLQSGRITHLVRPQGTRLMARGERVLVYQSAPRAFLFAATLHQIQPITLRDDIAIVDGLRLGDLQSGLLAYQAGYTHYGALLADLPRVPYEGILIQLSK